MASQNLVGELRRASSGGGRCDGYFDRTGGGLGSVATHGGLGGAPVTVAASAYRQNNPNVGLGNDGTAVVDGTCSGVSYAVRSGWRLECCGCTFYRYWWDKREA